MLMDAVVDEATHAREEQTADALKALAARPRTDAGLSGEERYDTR
jgi:hypothetical protein